MSKIKDENYYQISGWMLNKLNLKGTELCVYAIIYGFTQDGETEFKGSRQYLADFTGTSKPTIDKALQELCNKDLIIKITENIKGVIFNSYKINYKVLENFTGGKETLQGGCKETLHNNKDIDNNSNLKEKFTKEKDIKSQIEEFENENFKNVLKEFVEMRKKIKKPMTDYAFRLLLSKLNKMATNEETKIDILNQSIQHSWQDVYELKPDYKPKTVQQTQQNFIHNDYSKEQVDEIYTNLDNFNYEDL